MSLFRRGYEPEPRSRSGFFEAGSLPDSEKQALCLALLEEFGARNIRVHGDELIHSCPLPFGLHSNGDNNPSAAINWKKLTFHCFGCGSSGGLLWFISSCRGESSAQSRQWLEDQTGTGADEQPLSAVLKILDEIYTHHRDEILIPKMDRRVLDPWLAIHPYLTEVRKIPPENLMSHYVGWNPKTDRIVIPHFWKGDLVGWQTRRLANDGTPKYQASGDFPRESTIFDYDPKARSVVVVESPMSVLSKCHLAHVEATFGASVAPAQMRLLSYHDRVVLWFDNDKAGWTATEQVSEGLSSYTNVFVVPSNWAADPADLDDETFLNLLGEAQPYALWERPRQLDRWEG